MTACRPTLPRVAIVGGGFSGAVVALQLCRQLPAAASIEIIEPRPVLGAGLAYSATDPTFRINVPAVRMTVLGEDPGQFDRWAREQGALASDPACLWRHDFVFPARCVFGAFVAGLLEQARQARPDVALHHHRARATDIRPDGDGYVLQLSSGGSLLADIVVLAVSHPPPAVPAALRPLLTAAGPIVADPWAEAALAAIPPEATVVIVGTGLSMADVVASLAARQHRGPIRAFSRRGLLSRGHPHEVPEARNVFKTAPAPASAAALVAAVRAQVRAAVALGVPWQAVLDDVRGNGRRLWQSLPAIEQRRLVRHVRPFWDVHRFRVAPQAEAAIERLRRAGQFSVAAASLRGARLEGERVALDLQPRGRGAAARTTWHADRIVITTGPAHADALVANSALQALAQQGLLRADPAGLGLDVDDHSCAIGTDGIARATLLVAGPLARGRFGELMGLPQVSEHAEAVALEICRLVRTDATRSSAAD